jgi:hypothetical protein
MAADKGFAMMPCPGCGASMPVAGDACPSCGRRNEIAVAFDSSLEQVARQHGFQSAAEVMTVAAILAEEAVPMVRRAALGLGFLGTAVLLLFAQDVPKTPYTLGSYVLFSGFLVVVLSVVFWWLLGGRRAGNPFAMVRPIQLWFRRWAALWVLIGVLGVATEIAYYGLTGSRVCFCG